VPFLVWKTRPVVLPLKCSRSISARAGSIFTVRFPLLVLTVTSCPCQTLRRTKIRQDDRSRSSTCSPNTSPQRRPVPAIVANRGHHCPFTELMIFRISSSVKYRCSFWETSGRAKFQSLQRLFPRISFSTPMMLRMDFGASSVRLPVDAVKIGSLRSQGRSVREIADELGYSRSLVHKTLANR